MFKAAFITDLHYGIRANSDVFLNNIDTYLYKEFIPAIQEQGITHIFIGGDIFDSRQTINIKTFNHVINFFKKLNDEGFRVVVIAGNHDLYLSSSNDYTSLAFLSTFNNVTFIQTGFQHLSFPGGQPILGETNIIFMPWISNQETFMNSMVAKYIKDKICIGHFEFIGFNLNKTKIMTEGLPTSAMTGFFKTIISGHYHMRSEKEIGGSRIIYPGTPYQLTRADSGEARGFCILTFDGDALVNCEYINNKNCIKFETVTFPEEFTEAQVRNNVVDILVNYAEKFDEVKLDEYKAKIESFNPAYKPEIRLVTKEDVNLEIELTGFAVKSTVDLINEFIDEVTIDEKEKVRSEILGLYNQVKISE